MPEYRTPEEGRASIEQDGRVRAVLDKATHDGASLMVAMRLGEPADVVARWIDAVWNGLRDGLPEGELDHPTLRLDDRLTAIVMLLEDRMDAESQKVLRGLSDA
jgi:hypothetical protein